MLPQTLMFFSFLGTVTASLTPQRPLTREKGEIACFSCFAKNSPKVNVNSKLPQTQTMENMTEIIQIIQKGGMTVPVLVNRCEDTVPILNPNFYGANIHICPNSDEEPGACVKLKGYYKGEAFVYRECWSRMWADPRPFRHRMSGACFSDDFVQSFIESEKNTICFCEDDLCNSALSAFPILMFFIIPFFAIVQR